MHAMAEESACVRLCVTKVEDSPDSHTTVSCIISNELPHAISFFNIYGDGFGYDIETFVSNKWQSSKSSFCATGRSILSLGSLEAHKFDIQLPIIYSPRRIVIEYWEGKPFVSEPKHVSANLFMNKERRTGSKREPHDL